MEIKSAGYSEYSETTADLASERSFPSVDLAKKMIRLVG